MHFGHHRTTTAFKNRNFLKFWVFQGFPYTRVGHFELFLVPKISKYLQKMLKKWWKNEKNYKFFKNILNSPRMHFWHPRTITAFKNRFFLKNQVFQGFLLVSQAPQKAILGWFLAFNFQNRTRKCPRNCQKFTQKLIFFKNILNSPRMYFGRLKPTRNR